ncbi:MAG: UbiA prenyltransferase family protein [Bacilli bacterium]|nr:UbiA prenyltransferase family protein [Bacilli bacterium]
MLDYIKLIRPKHCIKNLLIFLPLFFSGKILLNHNFIMAILAFICFSLAASCVYILNDIKDREKDAMHPSKCKRPIASGKVTVKNALFELFLLLAIVVLLMYFLKMPVKAICFLCLYLVANICYSFGLKNVPIMDIVIVVFGFVIRVLFGASLFNIEVSNWLYLTILAISFYLALGKRRNEFVSSGDKGRNVLKFYSKEFLDKNMYMFLSMAIVFYCLWATDGLMVEASGNMLIWTIPVVIILCMKYSMNVEGNLDGDPTNIIFKDKILILLSIVLVIMFMFILYF